MSRAYIASVCLGPNWNSECMNGNTYKLADIDRINPISRHLGAKHKIDHFISWAPLSEYA
jgi:hypothetical protein